MRDAAVMPGQVRARTARIVRLALVACLLGVAVIGGVWAARVAGESAQINRYFNQDNELGYSTWDFEFSHLTILAAVLGMLAVASTTLYTCHVRLTSGRATALTRALVAGLVAPGADALLVITAKRGQHLWHSGVCPSNWMNTSAGLIAGQALVAILVAGHVLRRRSPS